MIYERGLIRSMKSSSIISNALNMLNSEKAKKRPMNWKGFLRMKMSQIRLMLRDLKNGPLIIFSKSASRPN